MRQPDVVHKTEALHTLSLEKLLILDCREPAGHNDLTAWEACDCVQLVDYTVHYPRSHLDVLDRGGGLRCGHALVRLQDVCRALRER